MYGAFDVVLYFVIIQLFWLLINLLLILSYLSIPYLINRALFGLRPLQYNVIMQILFIRYYWTLFHGYAAQPMNNLNCLIIGNSLLWL